MKLHGYSARHYLFLFIQWLLVSLFLRTIYLRILLLRLLRLSAAGFLSIFIFPLLRAVKLFLTEKISLSGASTLFVATTILGSSVAPLVIKHSNDKFKIKNITST